MNPLTLLGDSLKALASPPRLTYAPQSSSGYTTSTSNFGFWPGSASPSAKRDYTTLVGDPLQNYVIAAAVNAISLALPDAPPFLENLQDGTWKRVDDHPVLDFLRQPHEDLDDADVWSLTSVYRVTRGEAFWVIQLNDLGMPAEAVPTDPRRVRVIGTREQLISEYEVTTEEGHALLFPKEQIIHFRHLPAPHNLRRGWTPLSTGNRQLVGSNSASTYHTALLLNGAVSSWLISMKDATQGTVSPEQFQTFIDAMRRKYAGTTESAGGIDGLSIPLEIQRMAYSPDEMAIGKLIDYYEQTLCALTGVSKKLLDLGSDATYLNLREAINDFWERRLVPMRNKDARALTNQLLPLFGLDKTQWRVRFDYSNVPALQENQDQLFNRWRDLYKAGGIDLYTLQTKIGLPDVSPTYKERFFGQKPNDEETNGNPQDLEAKALWVESEHPRDGDGKWTRGSGSIHDLARGTIHHFPPEGILPPTPLSFQNAHSWQGDQVPPESVELQNGKGHGLNKIAPYARHNSKEASSVVLEADGSEFDFRIGNRDSVLMVTPDENTDNSAVNIHSHPMDIAQSPADWFNLLTTKNLRQSHVVGPTKTYSLHKPPGWAPPEKLTKSSFEIIFQDAQTDAFDSIESENERQGEGSSTHMNEEAREREEVFKILANRFGLKQRIGTRDKSK